MSLYRCREETNTIQHRRYADTEWKGGCQGQEKDGAFKGTVFWLFTRKQVFEMI